jgi:DNA-3-methyladenine glycosylase
VSAGARPLRPARRGSADAAAPPPDHEDPRRAAFYARSVHAVAEDLVGCVLRHGEASGRIVETESYHESEPACHAHVGLTPRTRTLFAAPGTAYVYRSYGIHSLLNAVCEPEGVGAAVLIRALEPLEGLEEMARRRGLTAPRELCSGPGKLTQALGIGLGLNGSRLTGGPIEILSPHGRSRPVELVRGQRIGITRAVELPWRFCDASSGFVSRPLPAAMRGAGARAARSGPPATPRARETAPRAQAS